MKTSAALYLCCPLLLAGISALASGLVLSRAAHRSQAAGTQVLVSKFAAGIHPASQASERVWRPALGEPVRRFRIPRASFPGRMIDFDQSLFLLSGSDQNVHRYSYAGAELHTYRFSRDEEVAITDFAITEEGVVWASIMNGPVIGQSLDGKPAGSLPSQLHVNTLAAVGDRLLLSPVSSPRLLYGDSMLVLRTSGNDLTRIPSIIDDHARAGMSVDGIAVGSKDEPALYYVTRYSGLIAKYANNGALQFLISTVVLHNLPAMEITPHGATRFSVHDREITMNAAVHNQYLAVVTDVRIDPNAPPHENQSLIDIYQAKDGRYAASVRVPQRIRSICIVGDELYGAANNEVLVWQLPRWMQE